MSTADRAGISRSILTSFLREVFRDGQVDAQERAALDALYPLLGLDKAAFDAVSAAVRSELEVDPGAGSLDPKVFLRRAARRLSQGFSDAEITPILTQIAGVLGVDPAAVGGVLAAAKGGAGPAETSGRFRIGDKEGVRYVEVTLRDDAVRTEAGAMRYFRGDIEMESRSSGGGIGGFFKAALTGETFYKPIYRGRGKLVLEPSFSDYFVLDLADEEYILDQGAYWASEMGVEISAHRNRAANALLSGEGFFQTSAKGTGQVVVASPGPVEVLDLRDELLVVDGSFAVARAASLNFQVSRSTKSLLGSMTSGEGLVNRISGTGRVYLAPIPNRNTLFRGLIGGVGRPGK